MQGTYILLRYTSAPSVPARKKLKNGLLVYLEGVRQLPFQPPPLAIGHWPLAQTPEIIGVR